MSLKKKFFHGLLAAVFAVSLAACGSDENGGTTGGTGGDLTPTQEEQALTMIRSLTSFFAFAESGMSALTLQSQTIIDCDNSGTIEVTESTIDYNNCELGGILFDGTITITESGNTTTLTLDITVDDGIDVITETGTITFDLDTNTLTMSIDATVNGELFSISADLTDNGAGVVNGTIDLVTDDGSATCIFNDFDTTTATDDDYRDACDFI